MTALPVGKLKLEQLQPLLEKYTSADDRVLVGAQVGEDAAVIDFGDTYLVAKTDPITFVADDIGWYSIVVNANDIATRGATPKWFLATLLLPEGRTTEKSVETIFAQLAAACRQYQIAFCGGHTEITHGLDRPILVGQMLGEVPRDKLVQTSGAQVGDQILLTKGVAIEATSIIARIKYQELSQQYPAAFLQTCADFIYSPGMSIVEEALIARQGGTVTAMHDPTEGGLATGLHEIAEAAGVGLHITREAIPVFAETQELCQRYGLDPLGVIASGALVLTTPPHHAPQIIQALHTQGIATTVIGTVVEAQQGRILVEGETSAALPIFHQDEITKIF
ncbi:hydrogenase expression/formation protein [candidate division KSB3 bacterium]|uniref:Hydrogenase expression/formation protein n=1 Tax=candidate division KSB3 bacterium TaxID=2044937 RepID=A0A9D5Q6Q0_9BACT|nr:hydrogenase expression/formation protein [candidate division KSB3 bacterium]MBD3325141.1 hydrogenase expression/formation protein [candidate division KSB3 bacterium]